MGLFSSSKSKSSSNVSTTTQNLGFSELSNTNAVSNQGSGNVFNMLDGNAISSAFDFAKQFSEQTNTTNTAALTESIKAVTESARTETENTVVQLKTLGIYVVAAWAAINVLKAWK